MWNDIKKVLPPLCGNGEKDFVLAYHSRWGIGVAWFWGDEEGLKEEGDEYLDNKYLCTFQFIKRKPGRYSEIDVEEYTDIFEGSSPFPNEGTITHWMPLPKMPENRE